MSFKIADLVYSRALGSPHRKTILAYLAGRASDDGTGIFCSKNTVAAATEIARSTVFKTIREFVDEGILIEVGHRTCKSGATVVYNININAVHALPEAGGNPSGSRTPSHHKGARREAGTCPAAGPHQSGSRTPPSPAAGPKKSIERSMNPPNACAQAREADFMDRVFDAMRLDLKQRAGFGPDDRAEAMRWLELPGIDEAAACDTIRKVMARRRGTAPRRLSYFTPELARLSNKPWLHNQRGHGIKAEIPDRYKAADLSSSGEDASEGECDPEFMEEFWAALDLPQYRMAIDHISSAAVLGCWSRLPSISADIAAEVVRHAVNAPNTRRAVDLSGFSELMCQTSEALEEARQSRAH